MSFPVYWGTCCAVYTLEPHIDILTVGVMLPRYLGKRLAQCNRVRALKERARALAVATRQPQPPPLLEHGKVQLNAGFVLRACCPRERRRLTSGEHTPQTA